MLELVKTADGSNTIFNPLVGELYHSRNGALQESMHVFLKSGLQYFLGEKKADSIDILEVGFGTGLNFLITADFCTTTRLKLKYTGIEAYPVELGLLRQTGYGEYVSAEIWNSFQANYQEALGKNVTINEYCDLLIANLKLDQFQSYKKFDIIYFDAFASARQPEMWTRAAISHICQFLKVGGVFTTYAITGDLKRIMKSIGFTVEKVPGAAGKREMLRSVKII